MIGQTHFRFGKGNPKPFDFLHFRAGFLPLRLLETLAKARMWAAVLLGVEPAISDGLKWESGKNFCPTNQDASASILDTCIVILGLACIIATGLIVGRAPGT